MQLLEKVFPNSDGLSSNLVEYHSTTEGWFFKIHHFEDCTVSYDQSILVDVSGPYPTYEECEEIAQEVVWFSEYTY